MRKTWADSKSQLGAYKVLKNAKAKADANPGYSVFDADGNVAYAGKSGSTSSGDTVPYQVRVSISNLNIRTGPGTDYPKTDRFTGVGTFTITAESAGQGASKWGKLKSGAGWISLDFAARI